MVAVGFSFACTVSEIGFCASGRSGFQKGYRTIWLNLFRLWLQYEICYFPFVECLVSYGSAFKLNKLKSRISTGNRRKMTACIISKKRKGACVISLNIA